MSEECGHLHGSFGVLAYDEATDHVQCHACGQWYRMLAGEHLQRHGLTAAMYKERYGLPRTVRLESPRITAARARNREMLAEQHVTPVADDMLYGERGVLAYDALMDRVQCHACGGWYHKLTSFHLKKHGLTVWTYKELYGLNVGTPLLTPRLSARQHELFFQLVDAGVLSIEGAEPGFWCGRRERTYRAEYFRRFQRSEVPADAGRSRQRWTDDAILAGLRCAQAAYGGILTWDRLRRFHAEHPDLVPAHITVAHRLGSMQRICELLGQPYRRSRLPQPPGATRQWTDEAILEALRALQNELGRPLTARYLYRLRPARKGAIGAFPSYKTVLDRFGSWQRVTELLGLPHSSTGEDGGSRPDERA